MLADGVLTTDLSDFTGSVVMDVSGRDTPLEFDGRGWDTLPQGSLIQIRAAGRRIKPDVPVIGWTTRPAGIDGWKFKSDAGGVVVGEDGIYIRRGTMVLVF